jgi:type IV secretion system protein VirB10
MMITGIRSDLPGQIAGQVSQDVYDTATGYHLLIPRGSRLTGLYDSRVVVGQERILVAWNRIVFKDGSSITLGAMPGADMAGFAGYQGDVDNHYMKVFGNAVLMTLITGGASYAMDARTGGGSTDNPSVLDELGGALASQLNQTSSSLLQRNSSIKPSLGIEPGYRFNIVVTRDIVFDKPYEPWR